MANVKEKLVEEIVNPTKIPDLDKCNVPSNLLLAGNDKTVLFDRNWFIDGIQRTPVVEEYKNRNIEI